MRKEAKITLALFVVLGGVVVWYAWIGGGEGEDLALGTGDKQPNGSVSTTDATGPRLGGPITSPLRAEPATTVDDDLSAKLMAAVDGGVETPATRPGKRGRPRGGDRSSRANSDDAGTRLDSILAALGPGSSMDGAADEAAGSNPGQAARTGDPALPAGRSLGGPRKIPDSQASPSTARSTSRTEADWDYTVAAGDTLAVLAEIHYGSQAYAAFLARANPQIENPGRLLVGMKLMIPPLPASMVPKAKPGGRTKKSDKSSANESTDADVYIVRDGDSLYRIAEKLLGKASRWPEIHAQNRAVIGDDPTHLKVGQRLRIPLDRESD